MKKNTLLLIVALVFIVVLIGGGFYLLQTKKGAGESSVILGPDKEIEVPTSFSFNSLAVGEELGEIFDGAIFMPEIITLDDGTYRMFYTVASSMDSEVGSEIRYADSSDGFQWESKGVALSGGKDTNSPDFLLGGASVVRLENGDWRMYYRATQWYKEISSKPLYQNFSAISKDGEVFTRELGTRISIQHYDNDSQFSIAGHGRYFQNDDGLFIGIFSANYIDASGASDLVLMTSEDGLNWGNFRTLYEDWHDPTVIIKDGQFVMYATYLQESQGVAVSRDGLNWPAEMTNVDFLNEEGDRLTEGEDGVADLGAFLTKDNEILIFTNYGHPGRNIAIFMPNN